MKKIIVSISALVLVVGIGVGLYFKLKNPELEVVVMTEGSSSPSSGVLVQLGTNPDDIQSCITAAPSNICSFRLASGKYSIIPKKANHNPGDLVRRDDFVLSETTDMSKAFYDYDSNLRQATIPATDIKMTLVDAENKVVEMDGMTLRAVQSGKAEIRYCQKSKRQNEKDCPTFTVVVP